MVLAGIRIGAKVGWVVQEVPSFLVAAVFLLEKWPEVNGAQLVLLTMFMGHYFNRSFIFPLQIKGGKDTSLPIVASAFLFTSFNGFIQAGLFLVLSKNNLF